MKNRGLYGQAEGNESRSQMAQMEERIADNQLIEGPHIASLRRMVKEKDWRNFTAKIQNLTQLGFSQSRIDSMTRSATAGVKL